MLNISFSRRIRIDAITVLTLLCRYDQYLNEKENPFDDSKRVPQPIPLAAPRPGYAAPVAALNLARPSPVATPEGRTLSSPEMSQFGDGMVSQGGGVPSTPHPLQPPMVPIAPVFARPSTATSRDVKFATKPIMRGETEDTVLRPRGAKGDDFWRRFSMVVKEDMATPAGQKQSMWLRKTQNGTSRMSRWVWFIGMVLLMVSKSFGMPRAFLKWVVRSSLALSVSAGGFRTTTTRILLLRPLVEAQTRRPSRPLPLMPPPPQPHHRPRYPSMSRQPIRLRGALTSLYRPHPSYTLCMLAALTRTASTSCRRTTAVVAAVP